MRDMHGSVWEFCSDFYSADTYKSGAQTDPTGPETGRNHVARGGCWMSPENQCTSAYRNGNPQPNAREPLYGLRVVCEVAQ
jgi:formylglycine-generating enzyme required for sulfatase activity